MVLLWVGGAVVGGIVVGGVVVGGVVGRCCCG